MKHIKSLGATIVQQKHKVFGKKFMDMICFYICKDYVNTSAVWYRASGFLLKPSRSLKENVRNFQKFK